MQRSPARRIAITLAGLVLYCTISLFAAWDKGFNFRGTDPYVSDGANETYVLNELYPTTRNSVTFGWDDVGTLQIRNRDAGIDRRLAGSQFDGLVPRKFRIDLTASGNYHLSLAMGDAINNWGPGTIKIYDTASLLATITQTGTAGNFADATGTLYSAANWPGSNTSIALTFATTICYIQLDTANDASINHAFLSQDSGGGGGATPKHLLLLHVGGD